MYFAIGVCVQRPLLDGELYISLSLSWPFPIGLTFHPCEKTLLCVIFEINYKIGKEVEMAVQTSDYM